MKPSSGRLAVIFVDAVTRKICIFFCWCPPPSPPPPLVLFIVEGKTRGGRSGEISPWQISWRLLSRTEVRSFVRCKRRTNEDDVVFFRGRTLTLYLTYPFTGDKCFLLLAPVFSTHFHGCLKLVMRANSSRWTFPGN